ncbi:ROK family transcriptional regulator [Paenibacillus montanisoli]|nr:ROK family transcriptional regulator [Paenibacillus montanisoli]
MRSKPGYLTQVKQSNMSAVLKSIWEFEPISRVELVERTDLTSGTLTNLTQDMIRGGIIRESESSHGSVGRKRMLLRLDTENYRIIGIDIGRNAFEVVLTDLAGRVIAASEGSTAGMDNPDSILDLITPSVQKMKALSSDSGNKLLGIGVSIPGPMDMQQGILLDPPNFPGWEQYPVRAELEKRMEATVLINDDARSSAFAERWFGLGRTTSHLVHITMGIGIGGGVVMNGEMLYGANGLYGQIGHITVVHNGEPCACGNLGCWETVGSIPGIMRNWTDGHGKTIMNFFEAVQRNDREAARTLEYTLSILTDALTNLFNVYDPDVIVMGGKLYPYLSRYMPEIRKRVQSRVYPFVRERVRIEASTFGTSQSAVGAAALIFDRLMREPLDMIGLS